MYHLTLDIQTTQSAYFSPVVNMPMLIYLEPIWTVDSFTSGYKIDLSYFWLYPTRKDLLCLSSWFNVGKRKIQGTLVMRFQESYKTLWNCIYNLDNWTTEDAKYFEKFSQSSKTTMTTYLKEIDEESFGVIGSDKDATLRTGAGCTPGTGFWPLFIGDLQSQFVSNLWHYLAESANFEGGEFTLIDADNITGSKQSEQ